MGCDMTVAMETMTDNGKWVLVDNEWMPFDWRSYSLYGWLAGVRNYSDVAPIAPNRGLPIDASHETRETYALCDAHSVTWVLVSELRSVDYDAFVEDRRCTVEIAPGMFHGGMTCTPGKGNTMTLREFLGEQFFEDLERLTELNIDRLVMWFDS